METFIKYKQLVQNPKFKEQKKAALSGLNYNIIDESIHDIIKEINHLPFCFTLQSCFGHFVYKGQLDPNNLSPLPKCGLIPNVTYRIAYVAFCIQDNDLGIKLLNRLKQIPKIDPEYIQFGCATWFWDRQINSYVVQVEPQRYSDKDKIELSCDEAKKIEDIKIKMFNHLCSLITNHCHEQKT